MMTVDELAAFLGIANESDRQQFIANVSIEQRTLFERMKQVELYDEGKAPCPRGVILCHK